MTIRRRWDLATVALITGIILGLALLASGLFGSWAFTDLRWWFLLVFTCCYALGYLAVARWVCLHQLRLENRTVHATTLLGHRHTFQLDSFEVALRNDVADAVLLVHSGGSFGIWVTSTRWKVRLDQLVAALTDAGLPGKAIPPHTFYL